MKRQIENHKEDSKELKKLKEEQPVCPMYVSVNQIREVLDNCVIKETPESLYIDLGKRTIEGTKIDFIMNMTKNENVFTTTIPVPSNYPKTPLRARYTNLFELKFVVRSIDDPDYKGHISAYKAANVEAKAAGNKFIFIEYFYVYSKEAKLIEITPSEKAVYNGLGKKMLCLSFAALKAKFGLKFKESQTLVLLEANGGDIRTQNDVDRMNKYIKEGLSSEEAEDKVCFENNKNLIAYYKKTYKFKEIPGEDMASEFGQLMYTRLSDVLESCNLWKIM